MTGLPIDPAVMAGAAPSPFVGPDGIPLDPAMMAGMQAGAGMPPIDPMMGPAPPM
jgi:hypothetical protein